jgi:hypothetical protein
MPAHRKASIRELTSAAFELDSRILEGHLSRDAEDGYLKIDDVKVEEWLNAFDGHEIVLIAASFDDERPVPPKICRTCGTEYVGIECPRCRGARIRLRGH